MSFSVPDQLEAMGNALYREASTEDTANSIFTQLGRFRTQWQEELKVMGAGLQLPVPRNKALHPSGCELQAAFLDFQYEFKKDSFFPWRAEYQVRVEGLLARENMIFELQDHWRLDTDMYAPTRKLSDESEANPSKEPHPLFHFQRGGYAQSEFAKDNFIPGSPCDLEGEWRGLMQTPGPRVPVLPLDPVLAIDFCLSQNDGIIWQKLRNVPEYLAVIEEAQSRLWRPFFESLSNEAFRREWFGPSLLV